MEGTAISGNGKEVAIVGSIVGGTLGLGIGAAKAIDAYDSEVVWFYAAQAV